MDQAKKHNDGAWLLMALAFSILLHLAVSGIVYATQPSSTLPEQSKVMHVNFKPPETAAPTPPPPPEPTPAPTTAPPPAPPPAPADLGARVPPPAQSPAPPAVLVPVIPVPPPPKPPEAKPPDLKPPDAKPPVVKPPEKTPDREVVDLGPKKPDDHTPPPDDAKYLAQRNLRTEHETVNPTRSRTGSPGNKPAEPNLNGESPEQTPAKPSEGMEGKEAKEGKPGEEKAADEGADKTPSRRSRRHRESNAAPDETNAAPPDPGAPAPPPAQPPNPPKPPKTEVAANTPPPAPPPEPPKELIPEPPKEVAPKRSRHERATPPPESSPPEPPKPEAPPPPPEPGPRAITPANPEPPKPNAVVLPPASPPPPEPGPRAITPASPEPPKTTHSRRKHETEPAPPSPAPAPETPTEVAKLELPRDTNPTPPAPPPPKTEPSANDIGARAIPPAQPSAQPPDSSVPERSSHRRHVPVQVAMNDSPPGNKGRDSTDNHAKDSKGKDPNGKGDADGKGHGKDPNASHDLTVTMSDLNKSSGADNGSVDYLPGVKQGEITSLNATDYTYAAFFNRMKKNIYFQWDTISAYRAMSVPTRVDDDNRVYYLPPHLSVKVLMVLNRDGSLDKVEVVASSGSPIWDDYAVRAIRQAAPFYNLPPALLDKNGKFVFTWQFFNSY